MGPGARHGAHARRGANAGRGSGRRHEGGGGAEMSLHAHLTAICDGCGIKVERDVPLNKKTANGLMSEEGGVI